MNESSQESINLEFPFSLKDRIFSNLILTTQRGLGVIIHAIPPLIGLCVLIFALVNHVHFNAEFILAIAACFFFTPLILTVTVATNYASNKTFREPFSYTFGPEGIHVKAATYQYGNPWSAVLKVKPLCGFLLFFIGPSVAHCIPLSAINAAGKLEPLLSLARKNGVKTC